MSNSVSALVPVHNGSRWLRNTFKFLEENLKKGDEIIFVENGSVDDSLAILKSWKTELPVQVISLPSADLVNSLNTGVKACSNNWIARFDIDDSYSPNRIEEQRKYMNDDVVSIFTDYEVLGNGRIKLGKILSPVFPTATLISLVNSQRTAHPSAIFSKQAFLEVGGYAIEDYPAEDVSLWLRLARVGTLVSAPITGLKYNLHSNSISSENYRSALSKKNFLTVKAFQRDKLLAELDLELVIAEIQSQYPTDEQGFQRALLLYWDLRQVLSLMGRKQIQLTKFLQSLSQYSNTINKVGCVCNLAMGRIARKTFRQFMA
jgi:glycosyltransferase involved in cell wall biosynthesis